MAIVNAVEILHGYFSFLPFFPFALLQTLSKYVTASEVHVPSVAWGKQSPSRQGDCLPFGYASRLLLSAARNDILATEHFPLQNVAMGVSMSGIVSHDRNPLAIFPIRSSA